MPTDSNPTRLIWRSRGYLPHIDAPGIVQSVTFRLADALPRTFLDDCRRQLQHLPESQRVIAQRQRLDAWLDRGIGRCHLRNPRIANLVERALLHFDGDRYKLLAWCVMPNHVHVIFEMQGVPLARLLHSWKSFTAKKANKMLARRGPFWQREYHDRFIRNDDHLAAAVRYVEYNPVSAGLAVEAGDWRWGSAWRGWENGV